MKITMYELLGLVKDSKAPKKIKYGNVKKHIMKVIKIIISIEKNKKMCYD